MTEGQVVRVLCEWYFRGYITADGPGRVKYTFTRSDGATGPVYIMDFKRAGTQAVTTDWTLVMRRSCRVMKVGKQ